MKVGDFMKVFVLIIAVSFPGCYVPYPSVGIGDRVRVNSWRGETKQRCCYIVHNIDTGLKDYDCRDMYPSECRELRRNR